MAMALSAHRSVSLPVSMPHRNMNKAPSISCDKRTAETSIVKQEHQRTIQDRRSTSETHSQKPMWFFLLSRTGQTTGMQKIAALHKTVPGLTWEEKWAVAEIALRESRAEQMAGIDEAILHMRRFIVYDGDSSVPNLFAGCMTDDDRRNALLARPSPFARMALDTFSRRTVSGRSMTSPSDEAINDIRRSGARGSGRAKEFAEATTATQPEDEQWDRHQSEDTDEEDAGWRGIVRSCGMNYGTFR